MKVIVCFEEEWCSGVVDKVGQEVIEVYFESDDSFEVINVNSKRLSFT